VAERNRLAAELKSKGDRAGAARLRQRRRPPLSAWAVNQLYWHERALFDALIQAAERLRAGDLSAASGHRDALFDLRERAEAWLTGEGHAATNATLERVTTTLAALAAAGTFDPDSPGALSADRDPTGFDFAPVVTARAEDEATNARAKRAKGAPEVPSNGATQDERARARERAAAERLRFERERAEAAAKRRREKQEAERRRIAASLRDAATELATRTRELERIRRELARAEAAVDRARTAHEELAARLAELDPDA
jgi:hypothetical protein